MSLILKNQFSNFSRPCLLLYRVLVSIWSRLPFWQRGLPPFFCLCAQLGSSIIIIMGKITGKKVQKFDLSILPGPQRALWPRLAHVPERFVLYGGTAIALHLGHRESIDFDFFTCESFTSDQLVREMAFLTNSRRIQESPNSLTVLEEISGFDDPVQLSFFGGLQLGRIYPPDRADNGILVASLLDLFGMKCATVSQRAEAKDYLDIYAILGNSDLTLSMGLGAAKAIYGKQYNAAITLKALSFYNDGNLASLPEQIVHELKKKVKSLDIGKLDRFCATAVIGANDSAEKDSYL